MENQRDFKGIWIPRDIWLDERLNAIEKILFAEIDSLSGYELKCIKSNEALAEFCQCSESKVSKSVKKLIDLGYVEQVSFDGRHRVLQSCLVKNARQNSTKCQADEHKMTASNSYSNSCSNSTNTPPSPKGGKDNAKKETDEALCEYVVDKFTSICEDLPKPMKLTDKRKKAILRANKDIEQAGGWESYFRKVSHSDFLCGKNGKWKASFDWLLNPANMTKVLEGNYACNGNYNAQTRYSKQNQPMPTAADYGDECF